MEEHATQRLYQGRNRDVTVIPSEQRSGVYIKQINCISAHICPTHCEVDLFVTSSDGRPFGFDSARLLPLGAKPLVAGSVAAAHAGSEALRRLRRRREASVRRHASVCPSRCVRWSFLVTRTRRAYASRSLVRSADMRSRAARSLAYHAQAQTRQQGWHFVRMAKSLLWEGETVALQHAGSI